MRNPTTSFLSPLRNILQLHAYNPYDMANIGPINGEINMLATTNTEESWIRPTAAIMEAKTRYPM